MSRSGSRAVLAARVQSDAFSPADAGVRRDDPGRACRAEAAGQAGPGRKAPLGVGRRRVRITEKSLAGIELDGRQLGLEAVDVNVVGEGAHQKLDLAPVGHEARFQTKRQEGDRNRRAQRLREPARVCRRGVVGHALSKESVGVQGQPHRPAKCDEGLLRRVGAPGRPFERGRGRRRREIEVIVNERDADLGPRENRSTATARWAAG